MRTYTLTPLVIETPKTKHMIVCEDRGTVHFVCETNPLATFRTFGPPEKCPGCSMVYPTSKNPIVMEEVTVVTEYVTEDAAVDGEETAQ